MPDGGSGLTAGAPVDVGAAQWECHAFALMLGSPFRHVGIVALDHRKVAAILVGAEPWVLSGFLRRGDVVDGHGVGAQLEGLGQWPASRLASARRHQRQVGLDDLGVDVGDGPIVLGAMWLTR